MHREIVQRMVAVSVTAGQDVIKQGDKGDYFYVAERGVYDVLVGEDFGAAIVAWHTCKRVQKFSGFKVG